MCDSSPIEHSIISGNVDVLQKLMDSGMDPNFTHYCDFFDDLVLTGTNTYSILNSLEFDRESHPLALPFVYGSPQTYEAQLDILYRAGSDCRHVRCPQLSPLLLASQTCKLNVFKSLVIRGNANINLYHSNARGNVVLLYAMVSYAKLFWLLQIGAECDTILDFNLHTGEYDQFADMEAMHEPDDHMLTLYQTLRQLLVDTDRMNVSRILLLCVQCSSHVNTLDVRFKTLVELQLWENLLELTGMMRRSFVSFF